MEWIEKLNNAVNYIEENLTTEVNYEKLEKLPAAQHITFKECLLTWQVFLYQNTSAEEKCL